MVLALPAAALCIACAVLPCLWVPVLVQWFHDAIGMDLVSAPLG